MNGGYEIEPSGDGANLVSAAGTMAFIPGDLVPRVAQLLREIDGKTTLTAGGKDYEGEVASEAEVRFKLGDRTTWDRERPSWKKNDRPGRSCCASARRKSAPWRLNPPMSPGSCSNARGGPC